MICGEKNLNVVEQDRITISISSSSSISNDNIMGDTAVIEVDATVEGDSNQHELPITVVKESGNAIKLQPAVSSKEIEMIIPDEPPISAEKDNGDVTGQDNGITSKDKDIVMDGAADPEPDTPLNSDSGIVEPTVLLECSGNFAENEPPMTPSREGSASSWVAGSDRWLKNATASPEVKIEHAEESNPIVSCTVEQPDQLIDLTVPASAELKNDGDEEPNPTVSQHLYESEVHVDLGAAPASPSPIFPDDEVEKSNSSVSRSLEQPEAPTAALVAVPGSPRSAKLKNAQVEKSYRLEQSESMNLTETQPRYDKTNPRTNQPCSNPLAIPFKLKRHDEKNHPASSIFKRPLPENEPADSRPIQPKPEVEIVSHPVTSSAKAPVTVKEDPVMPIIIDPYTGASILIDYQTGIPVEIFHAYDNLFRIFHSMKPNFDTNINTSFRQINVLIEAATHLECLSVVRLAAIAHLLNFNRALYKAIFRDPAGWLMLSLELQCESIFQEAIIHLVGTLPWQSVMPIPIYIEELIAKKSAESMAVKNSIQIKLLTSSISVKGQFIVPGKQDTWDTWIVVNGWRDWLIRKTLTSENGDSFYRRVAKGGDAYLPLNVMVDLIKNLKGIDTTADNIAEDLKIMKDYAKHAVKPLVANYSMLDVEEMGIKYLTNVKVESDEYPWITIA